MGEDWGHWLGNQGQTFRPFSEALAFARSLELPGHKAWVKWSSSGARPADIPSSPDVTYAGQGWAGWVHWLGKKRVVPQLSKVPSSPDTVHATGQDPKLGTNE